MKELFSIETDAFLFPLADRDVFQVYNFDTKTCTHLDSDGNAVDIHFDKEETAHYESDWTNDSTQLECIVNGFYVYTTHEYHSDPDGYYGCFGLKKANGEKITEELFYQVKYFCHGLCPVCMQDERWGCINEQGEIAIPLKFDEPPLFNQYGVADAGFMLIDTNGNEIPDTYHNSSGFNSDSCRYFEISTYTEEEDAVFNECCGDVPGHKINIFDTKTRSYLAKGIPDNVIDFVNSNAEPEVVLAAIELIPYYDCIRIYNDGIIAGDKGKKKTVFNYYKI